MAFSNLPSLASPRLRDPTYRRSRFMSHRLAATRLPPFRVSTPFRVELKAHHHFSSTEA
ncbi:hypothetical protein COLO4_21368 [Corchorus olitorius]|uniref:Uncharacterized protein n=1 Tax=Corchorus olitorius TaxID=93759 RepID=A0A1R3ITM6_9ROSI|nr:hypothetical protein COLO4_22297 [Corchorus olitorius]OMO85939.1 hypothetical protein COLO4_21368 [Corchorus olitorius]